jgi:glucosamine--fructose-6-phosphate aminotransferase (isomerizing)
MNNTEPKYASFSLCRDMMDSVGVMRNFRENAAEDFARQAAEKKGIFLTGEGSSRIFPAKHIIAANLRRPQGIPVFTEAATQAKEYDLSQYAVFGASNSGRTRETVELMSCLNAAGHQALYGLTTGEKTPLEKFCGKIHILSCGKEGAVAATKSVIEQALFYQALFTRLGNRPLSSRQELSDAADKLRTVLEMKIDTELIRTITSASTIYFAGRNDGVAEELALKTNEITRKKSVFLEGTYAVHGIEEVMSDDDVLIVVNPFEEEEAKFQEVLIRGVGMPVFALASRNTSFPTIRIPEGGAYSSYLEHAAGWNILVETGLSLGINLDKPLRARKVGNEYAQ